MKIARTGAEKIPSKNEDPFHAEQGDAAVDADPVPPPPTPAGPPDRKTPSFRARNLTTIPPKGNAANLTLGGIDLSSSGSVVVKADKKIITVLFQDGQDGRNLTLKAETLEDLYEWKTAFENALSQAPSSAPVMEENGILRSDKADAVDGSKEPVNNEQLVRSTVIGKPILFALEDADGAPTFLEKALRYLEEHGVMVARDLRLRLSMTDDQLQVKGSVSNSSMNTGLLEDGIQTCCEKRTEEEKMVVILLCKPWNKQWQ
ncbi:hypothetical protein V6N12_028460 [Hibiscus sabdariffa]|uniref:PH domain-containing protein n=1 Tax=Hibiscus sabdariffa TaxID=183260 RepID=A0ABR2F5W4_9ROSI